MFPKVLKTLILIMLLVMPGTSQSQQGTAPQKDKGSVDRLNAEDFAPKPKSEETKPKKTPQKPEKPAPSTQSKEEVPVSKAHTPGETWREPVTGIEFVWVPGGCYQMGCGSWTGDCSNDENPVHEVCVDGFWMGKYELTQGQWQKVMGRNPSFFKGGDTHPVTRVSWNDAQDFIRKLKSTNGGRYEFRLPSEAEWEYACRSGGKSEKYSGGSNADSVAWFRKNSGDSQHSVGEKQANGLGIYDMSGNVAELCEDIHDVSAYARHERKNPVVRSGGLNRVIRGGAWYGGQVHVRCTSRRATVSENRHDRVGLRLVRTE
jgi:formylglycine-generating enzyme required for sulfatase activity